MFDAVVSALFRCVADDVCVDVPAQEAGKNPLVASKPPESVPKGQLDDDELRAVGRQVVLPAPSMWN
jgi:hypothetical protein